MPILDQLRKDMFLARKNGEVDRANILSMAIASANNFKIEISRDLNDDDLIGVLRKEEKKLKESYLQYSENGREDLAKREALQLEVIQSYLPKLMSYDEVLEAVKGEISNMKDVTVRDMGKIMGMVMKSLKGKADGSDVSQAVKQILTSK